MLTEEVKQAVREIRAKRCEDFGNSATADAYRAGQYDYTGEMQMMFDVAALAARSPAPAGAQAAQVGEDADGRARPSMPFDEVRQAKALARQAHPREIEIHPDTRSLVDAFSAALLAKLARAEQKYGYSNGWKEGDWQTKCQTDLSEHVRKGDPLDVAAYAAFCWHHGWRTAPVDAPEQGIEDMMRALHSLDCREEEDAYRREGRAIPERWADPWEPGGVRQLAILRRRAEYLLSRLSAPAGDGWRSVKKATPT